jgi:hypothetical protein
MAFQLSFSAPISTTPFPEAYAVLTHVSAPVPSGAMTCEFNVFADKTSFAAQCPPISTFTRTVSLSDGAPMLAAIMDAVGTALFAGDIPELAGAELVE